MSEMVKNKGTVKELYAGDGTIKDKLRNLAQELGIKEDELYYPIDENDNYVDWKGNYYRNYEAVGDRLFDVSGAPNQYDYEADGEEEVKKVSEGVYEIDFFYYNGGTSFGELFAENLDKADAEFSKPSGKTFYAIKRGNGQFATGAGNSSLPTPRLYLTEENAHNAVKRHMPGYADDYTVVKFVEQP
jgi:hypothetical protein